MATGIPDLETYIRPYENPTAIKRLLFVAEKSAAQKPDALRLALDRLKRTTNTKLYSEVARELEASGEAKVFDAAWVETTDQQAKQHEETLEHDLHQAKITQLKDNIRQAHEQLCAFHTERGDYGAALKHVPREECSEPKHIVETCLTSINLYALLDKFTDVHSCANKGAHIVSAYRTEAQAAALHAAKGLGFMRAGRYKEAAQAFFAVKAPEFGGFEAMLLQDIATYAALCALVSLPRSEMQQNFVAFSDGLDLVPAVRDMARDMAEGKYAACLRALEAMKPALMLDIYLNPHVDTICLEIRRRCMIQYLAPFLSIYLKDMADVFQTEELALQDELADLISAGKVEAKIDAHARILYKESANLRNATYTKALTLGKELDHSIRALLLRMNLIKHELVVRDERSGHKGGDFGWNMSESSQGV
jgi:COP9 signalosome complex subunit 1